MSHTVLLVNAMIAEWALVASVAEANDAAMMNRMEGNQVADPSKRGGGETMRAQRHATVGEQPVSAHRSNSAPDVPIPKDLRVESAAVRGGGKARPRKFAFQANFMKHSVG